MQPLDQCVSMQLVGRGTEAEGFTQCALARTIATALGRDPLSVVHPKPVLSPDHEICKHCPLSLGKRANKKLTWHVMAGRYKVPTKSFVGLQAPDRAMQYACDAHARKAEEHGEVKIVGRDGLLPVIEKPPGRWDDDF